MPSAASFAFGCGDLCFPQGGLLRKKALIHGLMMDQLELAEVQVLCKGCRALGLDGVVDAVLLQARDLDTLLDEKPHIRRLEAGWDEERLFFFDGLLLIWLHFVLWRAGCFLCESPPAAG